jgi:hypothetical protein
MPSVPEITAGSITEMTALDRRPVYFLKVHPSSIKNVVVKGEGGGTIALPADAPLSIKWSSKLMKHVNNERVNTKIMTPEEITAFKQAALAMLPEGSGGRTNATSDTLHYTWTKMPMVRGLSDAEFWVEGTGSFKGTSVNLDLARAAFPKFQNAAVWKELGKVVAVDIFNGNNDRFQFDALGEGLGFWVNKGNVMFLNDGITPVIGLDTFDPAGFKDAGLADLGTGRDFKNNIEVRKQFNHLLFLVDPGERHKFAIACVRAVGHGFRAGVVRQASVHKKTGVVTPEGPPLEIRTEGPDGEMVMFLTYAQLGTFFEPYIPDFEKGLEEGAAQLKAYLLNKMRQYAGWQAADRAEGPRVRGAVRMGSRPRQPLQIGQRQQQQPQPAVLPVAAANPVPVKTLPQGILDRMAWLGWL